MVKNKSKKKSAGNLRQVLGAPLRQAMGAQLSQRMFTPATITDMGRKSGFDLIEIPQKKQPALDLWKL